MLPHPSKNIGIVTDSVQHGATRRQPSGDDCRSSSYPSTSRHTSYPRHWTTDGTGSC